MVFLHMTLNLGFIVKTVTDVELSVFFGLIQMLSYGGLNTLICFYMPSVSGFRLYRPSVMNSSKLLLLVA